jgi:hypothetical protein
MSILEGALDLSHSPHFSDEKLRPREGKGFV